MVSNVLALSRLLLLVANEVEDVRLLQFGRPCFDYCSVLLILLVVVIFYDMNNTPSSCLTTTPLPSTLLHFASAPLNSTPARHVIPVLILRKIDGERISPARVCA